MCGRFTLRAPASQIAEAFSLFEVEPFTPRFNVAPTQAVAAVRAVPSATQVERQFAWLRWGLVPSWAKDPSIGNRMINARAESVAEKPAFRAALRRRRCLVLADGFYEWQRTGKQKQPYFIRFRDNRPFAFAGLWETWEGPDHSVIESCTILTTDPNGLMSSIHNRMPVILGPQDYDRWLDPKLEKPEPLLPLLKPYPSDELEAYPIRPYVNSPTRDDPKCIEGIAE